LNIYTLTKFVCFVITQRWLAEDFQKERQRHIGNAKKLTKAVDVFHKTKEARKQKKVKVSYCVKNSLCTLSLLC
jgi:hypothetical protein